MEYFYFDTRYLTKPTANQLAIRHTFWVHSAILLICAVPPIFILIAAPVLPNVYAVGLCVAGFLAAGIWVLALGSWVFDVQANTLTFETRFPRLAYHRISLENLLGVVRMDDIRFLDARTAREPGALLPTSRLTGVAWRPGASRVLGEGFNLVDVMLVGLAGGLGGMDSFQALDMAGAVTQFLGAHRPNQPFLDPTIAYDLLTIEKYLGSSDQTSAEYDVRRRRASPMTEDAKHRASERRWLVGTCLGLIGFFGCLGYFWYSSHQAQLQIEAEEHTRKTQLQARLVAQVKAEVADPAYDGHIDKSPDSVSPIMDMSEEFQTVRSFIEYELDALTDSGVIFHLFNTGEERKALIRYMER